MSDVRQSFSVNVTEDAYLELAGELDAFTVSEFDEAFARTDGALDVTLDVSGLTFIDSTGLHAIVEYVQSREPDGTVTLKGASPHILRVFEITCLT